MSEERIPNINMIVRLPRISGNKSVKIELFSVAQFKSSWSARATKNFYPKVPHKIKDRDVYWLSEMYRARIDGKWHKPEGGYTFLTWPEIEELIKGGSTK